MNIFSRILLANRKKIEYENIISRLSVARVSISKPENYTSEDSDYSVIEASATAQSGSRYIYVYPKNEYCDNFKLGRYAVKSDDINVVQYSESTKRFALGNFGNLGSGTYFIYCYDSVDGKTIFRIKLIWTNE